MDRRTTTLNLHSGRRYLVIVDGLPVCGFMVWDGQIRAEKLPLKPLTCTVAGCKRKASGTLCATHRYRFNTYGDVLADIPVGKPGQRFTPTTKQTIKAGRGQAQEKDPGLYVDEE